GERCRAAAMLGKEGKKRGEIACIGRYGVRRGTALMREPAQPLPDPILQIGRGKKTRGIERRRAQADRSSHAAMVMPSARARKDKSSVPCPAWNLPGLRVPMHSIPAGALVLTGRRSSAAERTRPAPS